MQLIQNMLGLEVTGFLDAETCNKLETEILLMDKLTDKDCTFGKNGNYSVNADELAIMVASRLPMKEQFKKALLTLSVITTPYFPGVGDAFGDIYANINRSLIGLEETTNKKFIRY